MMKMLYRVGLTLACLALGTASAGAQARTGKVTGPAGPVTLRLFGSLVESGGRWKIYGFVVD